MKKYFSSALLLASVFYLPTSAQAAGFYLQEQSVSGLGTAFAGQVASPRDASIVYFNPAGMTSLDRGQINTGEHTLLLHSSLSNDGSTIDANPGGGVSIVSLTGNDGGNPYEPTVLPNLHIAYPLADKRFWFGLSVSLPFGLANQYNSGWFGRYDSTKTQLSVTDISPDFAFDVTDWLSVGGGVNIQYADAELESVYSVTTEGYSHLNGDDWSAGYNAGIMLKPLDGTKIGIHYRSSVKHTLDGRVVVAGTGSSLVNSNAPGRVDLDLPDIFQIGLNQKINDKLKVMGGASWYGWQTFDAITVIGNSNNVISNTVQNYQNTWAFTIGGEYELNDKWTLRAGYQFDETPTVDEFRTSRTPDGDRNWIATGATYKINDKISLDMSAAYIDVAKETINVNRNISTAVANVKAKSEGQIGIISLGLNYKF